MLARILKILIESQIFEVASFARFYIHETYRCIGVMPVAQRFPVDVSLMVRYVYAVYRVTRRHAHVIVFMVETGAETVEIWSEKEIVRAYDKNKREAHR